MAKSDLRAFPEGFLWGAATASHQVEGGNTNNDWWAWEQVPGHISGGTQSGLASDWWHRAEQDIKLAAQLGQNTHRLSLEWSRLEPMPGEWAEQAMLRYREILTFMGEHGLRPMVTLWHFTLPLWLYERGGWENPESVTWFANYVQRVVDGLGDLCNLWCTLNEPMVYTTYGHLLQIWPPGAGGLGGARRSLKHLAQAHIAAYEVLHRAQAGPQVGAAKHIHLFDAAEPKRVGDRWAAGAIDWAFNESGLAALSEGKMLFPYGWGLKSSNRAPWLDFLGLNYYSRSMVAFDPRARDQFFVRRFPKPGAPFSMEGWGEIYAEGLLRSLKRLAAYGVPVYVTEFGIPDNSDAQRPGFIVEHVAAMHQAIAEGVPLKGAYFWSLVDNFEWAEGWSARFGLIGVDPVSQERTVRPSAHVYERICRENALANDLVERWMPTIAMK